MKKQISVKSRFSSQTAICADIRCGGDSPQTYGLVDCIIAEYSLVSFRGNLLVNRFTSTLLLFLSAVLLFLSVTGSHGFLQLHKIDNEVHLLEEKNHQLSDGIADAQNQIYGVEQSATVLEKKAREELGLAKPNEIVYIFPEGKTPSEVKKPE